MALVVKNPPAGAGDAGDAVWPLGEEDPPEEDVTTGSARLVRRTAGTDRGARLAAVHGFAKSWILLSTHTLVMECLLTFLAAHSYHLSAGISILN